MKRSINNNCLLHYQNNYYMFFHCLIQWPVKRHRHYDLLMKRQLKSGKKSWGDGGRSAATHQQGLVELKQAGELFEQLVDAVQPLEEDGTLLAHVVCVLLVAAAVAKLVAEVQPVGLYKHLETLWIT